MAPTYDGGVTKKRPRSNPKPIPFITTGAILGFIVFSAVSWWGPNRDAGFDINYDPSAALGYMSVFGLFSVPTQSAYNSAKFAVRGFTDALRMELDLADYGVSCTTIHPGGIKTNIARRARVTPGLMGDG